MAQLDEHGTRILSFVERYQQQNHCSPTYREIGAAVGIRSTDHVARDLRRLLRDGYISYKPRVSKSIVLLKTSNTRTRQNALPLPYFNAADNKPVPTDELSKLAAELFEDERDTFLLRARGQAMRDAMLDDGDLVVVKRTEKYKDGDMLAIYLKQSRRTTLRCVHRENGRLRVQSANPDSQPQYYKPSDVEVRGSVLAILRKRDM